MKVAVYAICGAGEAQHVDRFMKSCRDADRVYVACTSCDTEVYAALVGWGAEITYLKFSPFRFDDARNASLARVSENYDVCVALDMDETLEPGWREALEEAYTTHDARCGIAYWIDFDFNGQVFRQNNRVHSRHGWRWKHPCHEALVP